MRLAVLSDIHGNVSALRAVLDDIRRHDVDRIVNLGDCFSGPLAAGATATLLGDLDLPTVRGNHDRLLIDRPKSEMGNWETWVIDDLPGETLEWCRSLPLTREVGGILLCHGTPAADDENWLDHRGPQARIVARDLKDVVERAEGIRHAVTLCGHTHCPRSVCLPDGRRIVNPGSVGCPAYLDTRMKPHFIQQTGAPDARYAIVELKGERVSVALMSVVYDATDMIALAREKGADGWVRALQTGWCA